MESFGQNSGNIISLNFLFFFDMGISFLLMIAIDQFPEIVNIITTSRLHLAFLPREELKVNLNATTLNLTI